MAANSVSRERYREYAHYLRVSADYVTTSVAPDRLDRIRAQVNLERNKFLFWQVVWLLIAVTCLVPMLMLAAVEFGIPLPQSIGARAEALHFQLVSLENALVLAITILSAITFPVAVAVAYAPIIANADAISDLENANRALKSVEKG